jgi:hypothetical protein
MPANSTKNRGGNSVSSEISYKIIKKNLGERFYPLPNGRADKFDYGHELAPKQAHKFAEHIFSDEYIIQTLVDHSQENSDSKVRPIKGFHDFSSSQQDEYVNGIKVTLVSIDTGEFMDKNQISSVNLNHKPSGLLIVALYPIDPTPKEYTGLVTFCGLLTEKIRQIYGEDFPVSLLNINKNSRIPLGQGDGIVMMIVYAFRLFSRLNVQVYGTYLEKNAVSTELIGIITRNNLKPADSIEDVVQAEKERVEIE